MLLADMMYIQVLLRDCSAGPRECHFGRARHSVERFSVLLTAMQATPEALLFGSVF